MAPGNGLNPQYVSVQMKEIPGDSAPDAPIHRSGQRGTQDTEAPPASSPAPPPDPSPEPMLDKGRRRRQRYGRLVLAAAGGLLVGGILTFAITYYTAPQGLSRPPGPPCCPNKWTRSDGRCYFISREAKNWESSLEFCQSEGGTLLPVDDETQQEVKTLHDLAGDYWVGLIKDGDSGDWRQLNGPVWTRPIEYDDPQRKCGFVHSGKYAALDCTTARRWICVKSLQRDQ